MPQLFIKCGSCDRETYQGLTKCPHCGEPPEAVVIPRDNIDDLEELVSVLTSDQRDQVAHFISYMSEAEVLPDLSAQDVSNGDADTSVLQDVDGQVADGPRFKLPMINNSVRAHRECPMCAEIIKAKAIVCRFCRYNFETENFEPQ